MPAQTEPFPPKPPPTWGDRILIDFSGTPNRRARCRRVQAMFWVPSCRVSRSPSQTAVVACGSIALWLCGGVEKVRSTAYGAAASAAGASPLFADASAIRLLFCGTALCFSASKEVAAGSSWYKGRTSDAAYRAISSVSATTTAIGWPFQCTSSVPR